MIPNFLIIGVQKSATSWIAENLRQHPNIFIPYDKEVHFFNIKYSRGIDWYLNQFKGYKRQKMIGEATPDYFGCQRSPSFIKKELGNIKIIVVLRNPVDRAYSAFKMYYPEWKYRKSFIRILFETMNDKTSLFPFAHSMYGIPKNTLYTYGLYATHIKNWYKYFDKKNMKIAFYDDLCLDPYSFIKDILNFLEVDNNFCPPNIEEKVYPTKIIYPPLFVLARKFIKTVIPSYILLLLRHYESVNKFKNWYSNIFEQKGLKNEDRIKVYELYKKEIEELEIITGRNLSHWKIE